MDKILSQEEVDRLLGATSEKEEKSPQKETEEMSPEEARRMLEEVRSNKKVFQDQAEDLRKQIAEKKEARGQSPSPADEAGGEVSGGQESGGQGWTKDDDKPLGTLLLSPEDEERLLKGVGGGATKEKGNASQEKPIVSTDPEIIFDTEEGSPENPGDLGMGAEAGEVEKKGEESEKITPGSEKEKKGVFRRILRRREEKELVSPEGPGTSPDSPESPEIMAPIERIREEVIQGKSAKSLVNFLKVRTKAENKEVNDGDLEHEIRFAEIETVERELGDDIRELVDIISREGDLELDEGTLNFDISDNKNEILFTICDKIDPHLEPKENTLEELMNMTKGVQGSIRRMAELEVKSGKKIWKNLAKMGAYVGAGISLAFLTGPVGPLVALGIGMKSAAGLAVLRVIDNMNSARLDRNKVKKAEERIKEEIRNDPQRRELFVRNLMAQIAVQQQRKIDQEPQNIDREEGQEKLLEEQLTEAEERFINDRSDENKGEVSRLRNERLKQFTVDLNAYLEYMRGSQEEKERARIKATLEFEMNGQSDFDQRIEEAQRPSALASFGKRVSKGWEKFSNIFEGKEMAEKATTAVAFGAASLVARNSKTIRRVMMGYAGMRIGGLITRLFSREEKQKHKIFNAVRNARVYPGEIPEAMIQARRIIQDKNFWKNMPDGEFEQDRFRAKVEEFEQDCAIRATNVTEFLDQRSEGYEEKLKDEKRKKYGAMFTKGTLAVTGAVVGILVPDLAEAAMQKLEAAQPGGGERTEIGEPEELHKKEEVPELVQAGVLPGTENKLSINDGLTDEEISYHSGLRKLIHGDSIKYARYYLYGLEQNSGLRFSSIDEAVDHVKKYPEIHEHVQGWASAMKAGEIPNTDRKFPVFKEADDSVFDYEESSQPTPFKDKDLPKIDKKLTEIHDRFFSSPEDQGDAGQTVNQTPSSEVAGKPTKKEAAEMSNTLAEAIRSGENVTPEKVATAIERFVGVDPGSLSDEARTDFDKKVEEIHRIATDTNTETRPSEEEVAKKINKVFDDLRVERQGPEIAEQTKTKSGIPDSAVIRKGEGVTHALIRQLKESSNPEDFGFKGDINDDKAVKLWAKDVAIKTGYIDSETGQEIRVGTKGIDKAAYVLDKDANGEIIVKEQFKGEDVEAHKEGSEFEGKEKEKYEYLHKKQVTEAAKKAATELESQWSGKAWREISQNDGRFNILEENLENGNTIRYIDANQDGIPDHAFVLDRETGLVINSAEIDGSKESIENLEVETAKIIEGRQELFEKLEESGISKEVMTRAGINPWEKNLEGNYFLRFLQSHAGDMERALHSIKISDPASSISPENVFDNYNYLQGIDKNGLVQARGVIDLLAGRFQTGVRELFGGNVSIDSENIEFKEGLTRFKDIIVGGEVQKNVDLLVQNQNGKLFIGIDGSGLDNWGTKGGGMWKMFGSTKIPTAELNSANIKSVLEKLLKMKK